jgi:hypothetical protein
MAGKRPAKPIAGQSKQTIQDPAIYGIQVRFLGSKNSGSICSKCNKETIRGMIRVKNEKNYCSAGCASSS